MFEQTLNVTNLPVKTVKANAAVMEELHWYSV